MAVLAFKCNGLASFSKKAMTAMAGLVRTPITPLLQYSILDLTLCTVFAYCASIRFSLPEETNE
jgi:hypothetical protein